MKRLAHAIVILTLFFVPAFSSYGQDARQKFEIPSELIESKDNPILLMFTASWCAPCHRMMSTVFPSDEVKPLLKKYNVIMLDVDKPSSAPFQRAFCDEDVVPYYVILDRGQNVVASQKGSSDSPEAFAAFLEKGIPADALKDAMPREKFDALVSSDYRSAAKAGGESLKSSWRVGVGAGAGVCKLTHSASGVSFDYLVTLYGRLVAIGGTSFQAGLQYEPLTGLGLPLGLGFRNGRALNLGFGVVPSIIFPKGDHRGSDIVLRTFDVAGRLEASYSIEKVRIGLLYNFGLVNQRKDSSLLESAIHNQYLMLTVSYDVF